MPGRRIDRVHADFRERVVFQDTDQPAHDFVREITLSSEELLYGARFIQNVGHISDDKREEGVLLADVLGITALCELLGDRDRVRVGATESSLLGPFYREGAPNREMGFDISHGDETGDAAYVHGKVTDSDGNPVEGVILDLWQTAPNIFYEG